MLLKPLLTFSIIRKNLIHYIPEGICVAWLNEVGKFVDDDVVDYRDRGHHTLPMEIESTVL